MVAFADFDANGTMDVILRSVAYWDENVPAGVDAATGRQETHNAQRALTWCPGDEIGRTSVAEGGGGKAGAPDAHDQADIGGEAVACWQVAWPSFRKLHGNTGPRRGNLSSRQNQLKPR